MSLYNELKRRNVFRVAIAYLALAWLLTEVSGTLFPVFGIPDWGIRFLVIVFALGFVPALIISWVYELTPEGIKREKEVVRDASTTHLTAKRLDVFTIGLIVVASAFILADRFWLTSTQDGPSTAPGEVVLESAQSSAAETQYPPNSIAVLPFVNMSDDAANEYFSDGVSEELLNLLAKIPELRVIARTSSFAFKGKDVKITDIARELKVGYVLEGSVRKSGNQVRITAQLIHTTDSSHLWSETFDRTLDDIFAIQDEIAAEVVSALKVTLLGETLPKARETNPEAYELYLQGKHFTQLGDTESLYKAEKYLRQSLAIDPNYAPSWERLATVYSNLAIRGTIDFNVGYQQARDFANKALELDPDSGQVHASLAFGAMMYDRDLPAAASHLRQARNLAPNDFKVLGVSSVFAETLGRLDLAIELGERALKANPLSAAGYSNLATQYAYIGQLDKAEEMYRKCLEISNGESVLPWLAKLYLLQGKPGLAVSVAERIPQESRRLWILPMAYYDLGQKQLSDEALKKLMETYADEAASFIADNHAWRGNIDQAFEWLDRAIDENQYMWGSLSFDPAFKNLHADPRWQVFRARVGRSEEQLREIEF